MHATLPENSCPFFMSPRAIYPRAMRLFPLRESFNLFPCLDCFVAKGK